MNKMGLKDEAHRNGPTIHVCAMCEPDFLVASYGCEVTYIYESPDEAREAGWELVSGNVSSAAWICPACWSFMSSTP